MQEPSSSKARFDPDELQAAAEAEDRPRTFPLARPAEPFWPSFDMRPDTLRTVEGIETGTRAAIRGCVEGRSAWPLVLTGDAGAGKSCAAACMVDVYGGWFTTASRLAEMHNDARAGLLWFGPPTGGLCRMDDLWSCWASQALCVVDEAGVRNPTDAQYESLKRAIDSREWKPLVVCSNLGLAALGKAYDDRIASRLRCGTVIRIESRDRRLTR